MELAPNPLSRKPLKILAPEANERQVDVDLTGDAVLTFEQRKERDIALNALAAQRRLPIPNNEVVQ